MINVPSLKPLPLQTLETDFGTTVAASIWRKIINNHTWVERAYPIGSILFFHEEITLANGDPKDPPNPDIWKFCDGTVISDPDSPLDGQLTPNPLGLFLKGSNTPQQTGGQADIDLRHNHGGQTGDTDDRDERNADAGGDRRTGTSHHHSIDERWPAIEPIIPKYSTLQCYIRYK